MENLLILQLLAHLIIDFYGQNDKMFFQKKEKGFFSFSLYYHALLIFLTAWLFSFSFNFLFYALAIGVSHLAIDGLKSFLRHWKYIYFTDQIAHIAILIAVVLLYKEKVGILLPEWMPKTSYLQTIMGIFLCLKPTNIFIKEVIKTTGIKSADSKMQTEELDKAGRVIGILERLLTLIFVYLGQYEAIGFLIAAKSILRFKDTAKTEYVLIGTLLSFGVAILIGVFLSNYNNL